jgi:hypothetical protein
MATQLLPKKKLILLHFQPLEKYPPVMNFINLAAQRNQFQIIVCTTRNKESSWFSNPDCKIYRFGPGLENKWARAFTYFLFNFLSFCVLLIKNPGIVFYYETLSSFPVSLYSFLRYNFRLFIHYHEYVSEDEKKQGSAYYRLLLSCEQLLLRKAIWISHTNEDRCELFYNDFPFLSKEQLRQLPNYPPKSWFNSINPNYSIPSECIRIVYVGSIGLNTMYIREFAEWVVSMKGRVIWDIYSDSYSPDVRSYFDRLSSDFIHLKQGVRYYNLPQILFSYQIGVVLYKGHIPNFIFNVPNKIVEYLACGLQVWYPIQMKSVSAFNEKYAWANLKPIDFTGDLTKMLYLISNRNYTADNIKELSAEESLRSILDVMKQ